MKNPILRRHVLVPLFFTTLALLRAATPTVLPVAVFDFEAKEENVRELGPKISSLVSAVLSSQPNIVTVERAELGKIFGEHELTLTGTINPENAARLGQMTGARVLVTGRAFITGEELTVVVKIISTETSRVYGELAKSASSASIADLSSDLAKRIATIVIEQHDSLMAPRENRPERVTQIKANLGDRKRPVVSVKITESHFGGPTSDPAAETELGLFLEDCGFKVVDAATGTSDIEISGEAFSAFGAQKGSLFSCKARVEVKARKRNGDLLAMDRQTSVAVDLTEQTAAKTALQQAAAEIAERLLPKIAL
jgi:hypothetical protein